jgi:hypothetical protein
MSGSSIALLSERGSLSLRLGGSRPTLGKGSGLVMLLKSRGMGKGCTGLH